MEPLTLTLLGYPLSILASITYDQVKSIKDRISDITPLKKLYLKSFYKAINIHQKHYDEFSLKITKKLKREICNTLISHPASPIKIPVVM